MNSTFKYKVGQKFKLLDPKGNFDEGEIVLIREKTQLLICFKNWRKGHNGNGYIPYKRVEEGSCWYYDETIFRYSNPKLISAQLELDFGGKNGG